jgi:hypothetical protein
MNTVFDVLGCLVLASVIFVFTSIGIAFLALVYEQLIDRYTKG